MNRTTSTLLLGAIIAVGFGIYGVSQMSDTLSPTPSDSSFMTGHLTLTAYNENGDIIAYRQTDNTVMDVGDNCIVEIIFTTTTGKGCDTVTDFDKILIGTGASGGSAETDAQEDGSVPLPTTQADVTITATGVLTNASAGGGAVIVLTAAFTDVAADIDEAALRNGATPTSGTPLAYQEFTLISLGGSDDLTVEWTITIDGT